MKTILQIAEECGMAPSSDGTDFLCTDKQLERFAARIRAEQQEKDTRLVDHILKEGGGTFGDVIRNSMD